MSMNHVQIFDEAIFLLRTKSWLNNGGAAEDQFHNDVAPNDPHACRFCGAGAVAHVLNLEHLDEIPYAIYGRMLMAIDVDPNKSIIIDFGSRFNDLQDDVQIVIAALERAKHVEL